MWAGVGGLVLFVVHMYYKYEEYDFYVSSGKSLPSIPMHAGADFSYIFSCEKLFSAEFSSEFLGKMIFQSFFRGKNPNFPLNYYQKNFPRNFPRKFFYKNRSPEEQFSSRGLCNGDVFIWHSAGLLPLERNFITNRVTKWDCEFKM
jgi:hypothetical protein